LNAGVSGRIGRGGSNPGEQVHQVRDRRGNELLPSLDEPASKIFIRDAGPDTMLELILGIGAALVKAHCDGNYRVVATAPVRGA
jgi:hypothetical protein